MGLKREVRHIITTVEQGNARPAEELDVVQTAIHIYARRTAQLASDDI
jgi:hypothetical protein